VRVQGIMLGILTNSAQGVLALALLEKIPMVRPARYRSEPRHGMPFKARPKEYVRVWMTWRGG